MSGTYSALRDAALREDAPRYVRLSPPPEPPPVDTAVVHVVGTSAWADTAAIHGALTHAWRQLGRPITVAVSSVLCEPGRSACAWALEHAFAGIRIAPLDPDRPPDLVLAFPAPHPRPTGAST